MRLLNVGRSVEKSVDMVEINGNFDIKVGGKQFKSHVVFRAFPVRINAPVVGRRVLVADCRPFSSACISPFQKKEPPETTNPRGLVTCRTKGGAFMDDRISLRRPTGKKVAADRDIRTLQSPRMESIRGLVHTKFRSYYRLSFLM